MSKQGVNQKFPPGWNESRVRQVLDYYESQTDEDAAAEIESALENTTMEVPTALVPAVRELIGFKEESENKEIFDAGTRVATKSYMLGPAGQPCPNCGGSGRV